MSTMYRNFFLQGHNVVEQFPCWISLLGGRFLHWRRNNSRRRITCDGRRHCWNGIRVHMFYDMTTDHPQVELLLCSYVEGKFLSVFQEIFVSSLNCTIIWFYIIGMWFFALLLNNTSIPFLFISWCKISCCGTRTNKSKVECFSFI